MSVLIKLKAASMFYVFFPSACIALVISTTHNPLDQISFQPLIFVSWQDSGLQEMLTALSPSNTSTLCPKSDELLTHTLIIRFEVFITHKIMSHLLNRIYETLLDLNHLSFFMLLCLSDIFPYFPTAYIFPHKLYGFATAIAASWNTFPPLLTLSASLFSWIILL